MTDAEPTALPSALKTDVTDARPLKLNVDVTEKSKFDAFAYLTFPHTIID